MGTEIQVVTKFNFTKKKKAKHMSDTNSKNLLRKNK